MADSDAPESAIDARLRKIRIRNVRARNEASTRTQITARDFTVVTDEPTGTNSGPTPLETVLAALTGCEAVILHLAAGAMKFQYSAVEMEAEGEVDLRGSGGSGRIRPQFSSVKLKITVRSNESAERFERLKKNVAEQCPVMNLFHDAKVDVATDWALAPP
jgi:uncharacterized OsmC-like protein